MITEADLSLLFKLLTAHLLTDFILQPSGWVKDRKAKKYKSVKLYLHAALTTAVAYIFSGLWTNWWLPAIVFTSHLLIDLWRAYKPAKLKYFLIDQAMHIAVLIFIWIAALDVFDQLKQISYNLITNYQLIITLFAYILISSPLGILIGIATEKWRIQAEVNKEGLGKAGMLIGLLERVLILTFILINQYAAIGFLIAAKSVLRFSDKENTQKKTEYVLIGTLMSFTASFLIGLLVQFLLKFN